MYCGDGINDLIALGAADVGMAVGSSDASAAATISNRNASIAGSNTVYSTSSVTLVLSSHPASGPSALLTFLACTHVFGHRLTAV